MILQYVTLLTTLHVCTQAQFHPMGLSPAMPMPMGMGMPSMPVHMPIGGPPQMPVVVMPYHSRTVDKFREKPKKSKNTKRPKKKRRPRQRLESDSYSYSDYDSSSSFGSSSSSDEKQFRTKKDHKRRRQVLTPVVSYVTKDGYVVYQKKIKKERAKDWLELGKNLNPDGAEGKESGDDEFETLTEKVRKKHRSKSYKSHN